MTIFTLHSNVSRCHHLNVCCQDCTKLKTTCPWTLFTFTFTSLLLNERVGNGFHSVSWTNEDYRGSSTYNQSQSSCVLSQFVWIVWIWKKKDLEDRIRSNKFQISWSLIRLCGSSGSDKIENLWSKKSQNSLILCQFIWIKKKRTEILFNKSQNLLLLCPFTFLVWIWLWGHKT